MMAKRGWRKTACFVFSLSVAGIIGFSASDAFAVAGKVVDTAAATSLAGTEVKFELTEGEPVIAEVQPDGTFETPPNVNKNNVRACHKKEVTSTGETKWIKVDCGWFLFGGGAAAAAGASAAASGWSSSQTHRDSDWRFDTIVSVGGTASLGSKDATTTTGGLAINGQSTSGLSGLGGTTAALMFRAHLPAKWTGRFGDTWLFLRGNIHFDRTGTGGARNAHNPVPGDETSTSLKRGGDIEFGLGKSFTTYCHEGNGGCQYIGAYFGASIQQNTITVSTNEIVRQPTFENTAWKPSYVAGVWYSVPLAGLGPDWDPFSIVVGSDFRRVPCMTVDGVTPLPATYQGKTDAFWEVTTWGGFSYTF